MIDGQSVGHRLGDIRRALGDFLYGMSTYELVRHAQEERASRESLFMIVTVGELLGVPVLPPYYALRLLPYELPHLEAWKRRALRERLVTDQHEFHLHGL